MVFFFFCLKMLMIFNLSLLNRYLKSVFPTVEEYLLLDVLSNSDNNVQKAADRLVKMGYVKRDTPSKNHFFRKFQMDIWRVFGSWQTSTLWPRFYTRFGYLEFGYRIGVCYEFDVNLLHKHQIGLTKNASKTGVCYKFDGYKIEVKVYRTFKNIEPFSEFFEY